MGIGVSLVLIAIGAILVWGVQSDVAGISEDAIGVILMVVGVIVLWFVLSGYAGSRFWNPFRGAPDVKVTDEDGLTDTRTVTLTITGNGDAPVITAGNDTGAVGEDAVLQASRNSDDFPLPDGPVTSTRSPGRTSSSIPSATVYGGSSAASPNRSATRPQARLRHTGRNA